MSEEEQVQEGTIAVDTPEQVAVDENRARLSGWTPKEAYRGDPEKWIDAGQWNKKTDELMPILRATNRRLETDLGATRTELAQLRKTMHQVISVNETISQREYDRALETLRKEQKSAIDSGDGTKWEQLEHQKDNLARAKPVKIVMPQGEDEVERNRRVFVQRNPWFNEQTGDPEMTGFAVLAGNRLAGQGVPEAQQFAEIERLVREKFPQKFANQRRNEAAVDTGQNNQNRQTSRAKGYEALPVAAKSACDALVKSVMTKWPGRDAKQVRESWVKDYFAEEA